VLPCYVCDCERDLTVKECQVSECRIDFRNDSYCKIVRDTKTHSNLEQITLTHVPISSVHHKHYVRAEEQLILNKNLSWNSPLIKEMSYVCDWPLCNDPRIVSKPITSVQFDAAPADIARYLQGTEPLNYCLQCDICTNHTENSSNCQSIECLVGHCYINQYIDDHQHNGCEHSFTARCESNVVDSSVSITAIYQIDEGILDIHEIDVYCSLDNCNNPNTTET
jgi:hypothetical protein